jgi:hypothetical protein
MARKVEGAESQQTDAIEPGPYWGSFEQFRSRGVEGLRGELGPNQVGRLNVKGNEFVIMHASAFNRLYGVAREVARLNRQVHLVKQAAQIVRDTDGSEVAVRHLADLIAQLPKLDTQIPLRKTELVINEDEHAQPSDYAAGDLEFELDSAQVRPNWTRS